MTKKFKIVLFSLVACLLCAVALPLLLRNDNKQNFDTASAATINDGFIRDIYSYNTTFQVPVADITTPDGTEKCSNAVVIFPDGKAHVASSVILSQCGKYTIVYDTGKYTASKSFDVYEKNFFVSSSASSAEYVEVFDFDRFKRPYEPTESEKDKYYFKDGYFLLRQNNGKGGISVDLTAGDSFTYNVPINVYTMGDLADIIKCYPENEDTTTNTAKAIHITVKLTDCYDSSNYIEMGWWSSTNPIARGYAGGSNQPLTGLEHQPVDGYKNSTLMFEGVSYSYHKPSTDKVDAQYGTALGNLSLNNDNILYYHGGFNFQYEPESNKVYSTYYNLDDTPSTKKLITDLDAPEIYTDKGYDTFKGFTTGECYLTLQTYQNVSPNLHIDIESIFGREGAELNQVDYVDTTAPVVTYTDGNTYDKPIYVNKNVEVVLPEVTAIDYNGNGLYEVTVYSNYGTPYETIVKSTGNKFTPVQDTSYTAVYTATDSFGNQAKKEINFIVYGGEVLSYTENKLSALTPGAVNTIPDINVNSINGNAKATVTITDPLNNVTNVTSSMKYTPEVLGVHKITYSITDGVVNKTFEYSVDCQSATKAVLFKDVPILEKYYIKGATYVIEDYTAYVVTNKGLEAKAANVWHAVNGGEFTKLTPAQTKAYVPSTAGDLQIKFECENVFSAPIDVKVIDANYRTSGMKAGDYVRYFMNDYLEANAYNTEQASQDNKWVFNTQNAFNFIFDASSSSQTVKFANVISLSNFALNFKVPAARVTNNEVYGNFAKIEIKLIDFYNAENTASVIYELTKKGITYTIGTTTVAFDGEKASNIDESLTFIPRTNSLSTKRGDGEIPKFTSDYCYLEFTISGITGNSAIGISKICNQNLRASIVLADAITIISNDSGSAGQGSKYTLKDAKTSNVLMPVDETNINISMYDPDGEIVTAEDGTVLNNAPNGTYEITLTKIGVYEYCYSTKRPNGKIDEVRRTYVSRDIDAPTVQFEDNYDENTLVTIPLGYTHKIKKFNFGDNYSANENMKSYVLVTTDNGVYVAMNVEEFQFYNKGYYKVKAVVSDEAGNTTIRYYNVYVK